MRYSLVESIIESKSDIPDTIHSELLGLFNVHSVSEMDADEKERIKRVISQMFNTGNQPGYDDYSREYALYYLPVNLQKIWRPLLDLAEGECLKEQCEVLELGAGPGSATFGLMEFYRYLSIENSTRTFILDITIVEMEQHFIDVFRQLFEEYQQSLPDNLRVHLQVENSEAFRFIDEQQAQNYDLIIESNMLNPNENIDDHGLEQFAGNVRQRLKPHSAVILIEPAKRTLSNHLRTVKRHMMEEGMSLYSPCSCDQMTCRQFASAELDIRQIQICRELSDEGIIKKELGYHAFEYAVLRNDRLKKFNGVADDAVLAELDPQKKSEVSFHAFVLSIANPDKDTFALKICDGSLTENQSVWINIPKKMLVNKEINALTCGRGSQLKVKKATVTQPNRLDVNKKTQITIY